MSAKQEKLIGNLLNGAAARVTQVAVPAAALLVAGAYSFTFIKDNMNPNRIQSRPLPTRGSNSVVDRPGNRGNRQIDPDRSLDSPGMPAVFQRDASVVPETRRSPRAPTPDSTADAPMELVSPQQALPRSSREHAAPLNPYVKLWDEVGTTIHRGPDDEHSAIRSALGRLSGGFRNLDNIERIDRAITHAVKECSPQELRLLRQAQLGLRDSPDPLNHRAYEIYFALLGAISMTAVPEVGVDFGKLRPCYLKRLANFASSRAQPEDDIAASPDGGESSAGRSSGPSQTRTADGARRRNEKTSRPAPGSARKMDKSAASSGEQPASKSSGKAPGSIKLSMRRNPELPPEFMPAKTQTADAETLEKERKLPRSRRFDRRSQPIDLRGRYDEDQANALQTGPDVRVTQPQPTKATAASSVSTLWDEKKVELQNLIRVAGAHQAVQAVLSRLPGEFVWDRNDASAAVRKATESAGLSAHDEDLILQAAARMLVGARMFIGRMVLGDRLEEVMAVLQMIESSFSQDSRA